jgi:hypothetical protein
VKIKSISYEHFDGLVYNFHCTPDENYFANGILVHNCYKANGPKGSVMSFETFKMIFDKLPQTVNQIAFGADAKLESCPDLWKMMEYCRANHVVPNITAADIDEPTSYKLAKYCGAVSCSFYGDEQIFLRSLQNLKKAGLRQINCHVLISEQTVPWVHHLIDNWELYGKYLNAIVCLQLKTAGRGKTYTRLNQHEFTAIVKRFLDGNIPFGSDSCGVWKVVAAFEALDKKAPVELLESCESTLFSLYINAKGVFFPCSFNEKPEMGIKLENVNDFVKEVWHSDVANQFRESLKRCKNHCPSYTI